MKLGDAEKLAALWSEAQPSVTGFVRTLVADRQQAEELVQRTAVTCVKKFSEYDSARPFIPWAVGIARLEIFAWRRSSAKQPQILDETHLEQLAISYQRLLDRENPLRDALGQCLEESDGRSRQALDLYYGHGMTTEEIGQQMDLSGGAVRVLLCRTRGALRACIERRLGALGGST